MISEARFVTLGVAEMERAVAFYRQAFGYEVAGRGRVEGAGWKRAWRMAPELCACYTVVGRAETATGRLRLLDFDIPGEAVWRDYSRRQDLGHYAVNVRVEEIRAAWEGLLAAGARPKSPPHYWRINAGLAAWDCHCYDHDGTLLDVFQLEGGEETFGPLRAPASEIQTVAIHVRDAVRSKAFYEGLGFRAVYDEVVENIEGFLGVPAGTRLHNINLQGPAESPNGRIELAQYLGWAGKSLRHRARPPRLGILSISFETDSLPHSRRLLRSLGGEEAAPPADAIIEPVGAVRLVTFYGPDGELLELYERRA